MLSLKIQCSENGKIGSWAYDIDTGNRISPLCPDLEPVFRWLDKYGYKLQPYTKKYPNGLYVGGVK